jgi:hypothetical protein
VLTRSLIGIALAGLVLGAFGHPERAVSTTRKVGELATRRAYATATPYDGGFLVAWEDGRLGPTNVASETRQSTVFASRMNAAGTTLDPSGMRLSTDPFDQSDPAPGCIGVQCIVAWQQRTRGVCVRAYNAATNVWGPQTSLNSVTTSWLLPRLAPIGNRFIVAWRAPLTGVQGRFVAVDGTPEPSQLSLVTVGNPDDLSVASNGSSFLVTWNDLAAPQPVSAQVFSASGTRVSAPQLLGGSSSCRPVAATVGNTYLIAWCDGSGLLTVRKVSDTGAVGPILNPLGVKAGRSAVTLVADGPDFVVGWVESTALHGARLNAATLEASTPDQVLRNETNLPFLLRFSAVGNGQALATWSLRSSNQMGSRLLQVVNGGLVMLDAGVVIQQRPDVHFDPRVARLGSGFVTAWNSLVDDRGVPMARALDPIGQPVASSVVLDPPALDINGVDVSYDGTMTWAAWATQAEVKVAQLDRAGQPVAVVVAGSADSVFSPRLAHRGPQTLVTWAWYSAGDSSYGISGHLLGAPGQLEGAELSLTFASSLPRHALAASATQFGVAWAIPPNSDLYFSTIAADGGLAAPPLGPIAPQVDGVSLASNGTDFLLTWSPTSPGVVKAVRITAARAVLDATPMNVSAPQLALSAHNLSLPEVSFDGTDYQVAWAEVVADGGALDVHRRSIASDGTLGPVEVVAGGLRYQHNPALTSGTSGRTLVAWVDSDEGGDEVMRVRARAFAALPAGQACFATSECLDGQCLSGLCCSPLDGGCPTPFDGGGPTDAGLDAGTDAGTDAGIGAEADAGIDAGTDAGIGAETDAGIGAETDAGIDAGTDAGIGAEADAGTDAETDAGIGADIDAGVVVPGRYAVGCDCSSTPSMTFVGFALLGTLLRARSRRSPASTSS